jgi:hypothetical protein
MPSQADIDNVVPTLSAVVIALTDNGLLFVGSSRTARVKVGDIPSSSQSMRHLRMLLTIWTMQRAHHYKVAHDLSVVVAQLMVSDEMAFLEVIMDIERARRKIIGE